MLYYKGKAITNVGLMKVEGKQGKTISKKIVENGVYVASNEGANIVGYNAIEVNVPTHEGLVEQIVQKNITELDLSGIQFVGSYSFARSQLEKFRGENVENIEEGAFAGCSALKEIAMPNLTYIGESEYPTSGALSGIGASEVIFPNLKHIGRYAFCNSKNLKKVVTGEVNVINEYAFSECVSLDTLVIDDNDSNVPHLLNPNAFSGTPIGNGNGYIYTDNPSVLKIAENWDKYAQQIKSKTEPILENKLEETISTTVNGKQVTLSINAHSLEGELSYQWYKDGQLLSGDKVNNATLSLGSNKNIEGTYRVEVISENGEIASSNECVVTVTDESIIAGEKYTSNVTASSWYNNIHQTNTLDSEGTYLTDGVIRKSMYDAGFLGAVKVSPEITFDFTELKHIKELHLFSIMDVSGGVAYPTNLWVEYKENASSEWKTLYNGEWSKGELVLIAQKDAIPVKSLRLKTPYSTYTFISEVRAFSETTGKAADGMLVERGNSLIYGIKPSDESTVIPSNKYASGGTKDASILTDGFVRTDAVSYKHNLTFSVSPVSFIYDTGTNLQFQEVQIASHNPTDAPLPQDGVKGIGGIKIEVELAGIWHEVANVSNLNPISSTKIYTFTSDTTITSGKIRITLTKNENGTGWNGMSISEISVFEDIRTLNPDGKMELKM